MRVAIAFVVAFMVGVVLALMAADVRAEWTPRDRDFYVISGDAPKARQKPKRRPVTKLARPRAPVVAKVVTVARIEREPLCLENVQREGEQWATEDGAKENAIKSWSQAVRFQSGELYADFTFAQNARTICLKSSVSGGSGLLKRCRIVARPCKPVPAE